MFIEAFHKFVGPGDDLSLLDLFQVSHGKISLDDDGGLSSLRRGCATDEKKS